MSVQTMIHILPDDIANKIAAGEVVERPASVIKELLENAVDAQATRISVVTEAAGMKRIQVVDNGGGMSPEDLTLAIIRHATSKISTEHDLKGIKTLGFRGEALPSIAAISHLEIISRRPDTIVGARIRVEGGKVIALEETASPIGTTVNVNHLFFNTPARKEFMKTAPAENAAISEMLTRFALAHPGIAFSLVSDGQRIFQSTGRNQLLDVVTDVYGADIARKMVPIANVDQERQYSICGYAAPPQVTRSNRRHILTFINKRWVKSDVLDTAVLDAYDTLLPLHRYPVCILALEFDPKEIDVNVHPAKLEVRFHNEAEIREFVTESLRTTLLAKELVPDVFVRKTSYPAPEQSSIPFQVIRETSQKAETRQVLPHDNNTLTAENNFAPGRQRSEKSEADWETSSNNIDDLRILGQLLRTYILVERAGELLIIDQHAAQERTMYERLTAGKHIQEPAQQLLIPVVFEMDPTEANVMESHAEILTEVGFSWEEASGRSIFLREIPAGLNGNAAEDLLRTVLADLADQRRRKLSTAEQKEAVMRAACRASVKANDTLSIAEMRALVRQLLRADNPYTCPHGRPTMLKFSQTELEKMFRRI